jgi:uncharacterized protein with beta-barrel porin domain
MIDKRRRRRARRAASRPQRPLRALAGLGAAATATMAMALGEPAHGQTFQDEMLDLFVNGTCSGGGSGAPAGCETFGISPSPGGQVGFSADGMAAAQRESIEARLREMQCGADGNAGCLSASSDAEALAGLNFFVAADYQFTDKDETDAEAGFTSNRGGLTVGVDSPFANGVIGGAFSYGHTWGEFDGVGGDFDLDSFGTFLYGSYYPTDASFIDAVVGLALKDYEIDRRVVAGGAGGALLGFANGDTTGHEVSASLGGGYDFSFGAITVGPRVGLHYVRTEFADFTERGTALALHYEEQVEDSLTTTLGVQGSWAFSTGFGVVVPQVSAEYVHEFLNDRRTVHAVSTDGTNTPVDFVTDPPDRDYFNLGAGLVFVLPDGISPFLNYSAEVANRFQEVHTVSAGVRFEL